MSTMHGRTPVPFCFALVLLACDMSGGPILTPDAGMTEDAGMPERDAGEPPDVQPPFVNTTVPDDGAIDVAPDGVVRVVFSEAMAPSVGTVHVDVDTMPTTTALGTWSADGTELSFTSALPSSARVRVTIERDFTDLAGNPLPAPYVFEFQTVDAIPPVVTSTDPAEGASGVSARVALVRISFSESMGTASGTLALEGGPGTLGAPQWILGGMVVPVSGLAYDTAYRIVLNDFADPAGNALDGTPQLGDGAIDFTTGPDTDAPHVVDASPSEGQVDVSDLLESITVIFDEPMETSVTSFDLSSAAGSTTLSGTWSLGGTRLDLDVPAALARNTAYRLSLAGLRDAAGNALDPVRNLGDGALDFVTGVDIFAPYVGYTDPIEGSTNVSFRQGAIVVVFSESMDTIDTTVEISDGATTFTATGAWSLSGTRFTIDVANALYAGRSYTVDFSSFRDAGGTALDTAHPYLGDGVLEFTLSPPTGENCHDVLTTAQASSMGGVSEWVLAPGVVSVIDGGNTCPGNNSAGVDAVIRYTKTTPSIAGGGTALRIYVESAEATTNAWMSVSVLRGTCDPTVVGTGADRLRCVDDRNPQVVYLDVGPGDYYLWVSRYTGSDFRGGTVRVEEIALPPEGETCAAPFTTATASPTYTAPATAADSHVWTLGLDAVEAMDHAVAGAGTGAMPCDHALTGGGPDLNIGVDAVIALPKSSSTTIGWLQIEATHASYELVAEVRNQCEPGAAGTMSLACAEQLNVPTAGADIFETTFSGAAGDYYLWLAGDASYNDFPGAIVRYRDIEPGPGDSCATAIPITAGTTAITPDRPHRLPAPSCFARTDSVTWYRFTTTERFTHVRTTGDANVATVLASGTELGCQAAASTTPFMLYQPVGTEVCVAVASGSAVSGLTLTSFPYDGNLGRPTHLGIDPPLSGTGTEITITGDQWMTVTPTTLYMGLPSSVIVAPRSGGTRAEQRTNHTVLGNGGVSIGEAVWALDDSATAGTTARLFRIVDPLGGSTPVPWDTGTSWPADGFDAITYEGTSLLVANDYASATLPVQLRTFSATAAGTPTAPITVHSTLRDVVAIAVDSTWLYMIGGVAGTTTVRGVYRIQRSMLGTGTPELIAPIPVSAVRGALFVDSPTAPRYLYARASTGDVHVIADPGGTSPMHLGAISTLGESADFAMAYDATTGSLFIFETETDSTGNFVRLD